MFLQNVYFSIFFYLYWVIFTEWIFFCELFLLYIKYTQILIFINYGKQTIFLNITNIFRKIFMNNINPSRLWFTFFYRWNGKYEIFSLIFCLLYLVLLWYNLINSLFCSQDVAFMWEMHNSFKYVFNANVSWDPWVFCKLLMFTIYVKYKKYIFVRLYKYFAKLNIIFRAY